MTNMTKPFKDFFPTPDLLGTDSLLCIQPHPDDMEIGAGATIAHLAERGADITCLTVTDGSAGTYNTEQHPEELSKIRRVEAEESAAFLGVKSLLWLDFADGGYLPYEELRAEISRAIRLVKPRSVMVCDPWLPYEVHSDHIRTGLAAAEAAFLANMPNFCPSDLQEGLNPHEVEIIAFYYTAYPNTFVDTTNTWEKKLKAISCHKSQFSGEKMEQLQLFLEAKSEHWKEKAGLTNTGHVEALKVVSPAHLHIFEEAWRG